MRRVILRALSPRAERYQTALEMGQALEPELRALRLIARGDPTEAEEIGSALRERRLKVGLTVEDLATGSGVPTEDIERFEDGRAIPPLADAIRLARLLEIELEGLFDEPDRDVKSDERPRETTD